MFKFDIFLQYLKYLIKSKGADSVHSPFVFNLYFNIIKGNKSKEKFKKIELLRTKLLNDNRKINIEDFGAGSQFKNSGNERKLKNIVASSSMKPKFCRLLASLVEYSKPENILEFGTSVGLSTMYLATQCPDSKIYTIEGSEEIYKVACNNFNNNNLNNIIPINNTFDKVLERTLEKIKKVDFVLFDGNHKKKATLKYFEKCLLYSNSYSVFVFDDINWSKEMRDAWKIIQEHPKVSISIDLFFCGLVFFRTGIIKQDFCLRF